MFTSRRHNYLDIDTDVPTICIQDSVEFETDVRTSEEVNESFEVLPFDRFTIEWIDEFGEYSAAYIECDGVLIMITMFNADACLETLAFNRTDNSGTLLGTQFCKLEHLKYPSFVRVKSHADLQKLSGGINFLGSILDGINAVNTDLVLGSQEPVKLNRKRIKKGKTGVAATYIVKLRPRKNGNKKYALEGKRKSPKGHIRRRHKRKLSDGRKILIPPMNVCGGPNNEVTYIL